MPDDSFVQVENLHRHYGNTHALKGVSFQVERGEVLGLLGPNGAGKTTTMQLLAGALAPSAGDIRIGGKSILAHPKACKSQLGYLPENPPLYPELTVDEYLRYCARLRRIPSQRNAEAIDIAKSRCGLSESGPRLIGNLSKGYRQRVGIAQAIVHSPALVILDEPTVGLDPNQIREIRRLIAELRGDHSIILSTHILPEAQSVCDRVQIINEGKLVLNQSLKDMTGEQPRHLKVRFTNPPDKSTLGALPTVDLIEPIEPGLFRLRYQSRETLTQALLVAALEGEWGLTELTPEHDTLETLFVRLTTGEQAGWMSRVIFSIAARELRSFFCSPPAWTVLAIVTAIHAYVLLVQVERFTGWQSQLGDLPGAPGLTELVVLPLIKTAGFVLLMVVPLMTMHLVAEERRSGTLILLLSSPLSMTEIVVGKYLGVMGYLLSLVAAVGALPLMLLAGGTLDVGLYLASMLALSLMIAGLAAAGLFVSTLTRHPAVAAVGSFGLLLILWILDWTGNADATGLGAVFTYLALGTHFDPMLKGVVDTHDIVYFLLLIGVFLGLSIRHLDAYRSGS